MKKFTQTAVHTVYSTVTNKAYSLVKKWHIRKSFHMIASVCCK